MKNTDERNRKLVAGIQKNIKELLKGNEYLVTIFVDAYGEDMRRTAEMALIKAATMYPLDSSHKFNVYATWWMRIAIRQELGLSLEITEQPKAAP